MTKRFCDRCHDLIEHDKPSLVELNLTNIPGSPNGILISRDACMQCQRELLKNTLQFFAAKLEGCANG